MTVRGMVCLLLDGGLLILALGSGLRSLLMAGLCLGVFILYAALSMLSVALSLRAEGELSATEVLRKSTVVYTLSLRGVVLLPVVGHLSILPPGVGKAQKALRQRHALFLLPSWGRRPRRFVFTLDCPHRGCWTVGSERLRVQDIFGLFSLPPFRSRHTQLPLAVLPRTYPLPAGALSIAGNGFSAGQSHSASDGALFGDTRLYQTGDSLRRIHWKQTARSGKLYVRQYEGQSSAQLLLLLDMVCPGKETAGLADLAAETTVSLVQHALVSGQTVRLVLVRAADGVWMTEHWLREETALEPLRRQLAEVKFWTLPQPLDPWLLRSAELTATGAVRVVTAQPSEALLAFLNTLRESGLRVSCLVPAEPQEDAGASRISGADEGVAAVYIRQAADIPKKVGDAL